MKNYKVVLFSIFVALYVIGLFAGSFSQTGTENQNEMHAYLESAVSGYSVPMGENIKEVLEDNLKTLLLLTAGGILLIGPVILAVMLVVKGYMAGFAITAMLRLYGVKGMLFCGANLLSAAILIPAISFYATLSLTNILTNRYDNRLFFKTFFIQLVVMIPILLFEGTLRGILSSILLGFAAKG